MDSINPNFFNYLQKETPWQRKKMIVLVGGPATGETTLARAIADKFGKNYNWDWRRRDWMGHIPEDAAALIVDDAPADFFRVHGGPGARVRIGDGGGPIMRRRTAQDIEYTNVPRLIVTTHSLPDDLDPGLLRRLDITTLTLSF